MSSVVAQPFKTPGMYDARHLLHYGGNGFADVCHVT